MVIASSLLDVFHTRSIKIDSWIGKRMWQKACIEGKKFQVRCQKKVSVFTNLTFKKSSFYQQ